MSDTTLPPISRRTTVVRRLWSDHRVWFATAAILVALTLFDPVQGVESIGFTTRALLETAPYLLLSIGLAAK